MSNISIPTANDPHGNPVPIEEAIRYRLDYYTCPECGEFLEPRKGPQRQYYAHKRGCLDDVTCSLSSQAGIDEMVEELRTSDIEQGEKERTIRIYVGEEYDGHLDCFGIIPSLEWGQIPQGDAVDPLLNQLNIESSGVQTPPVPQNFHPSEDETLFSLDPDADDFQVSITGPKELAPILGDWTADGLADGDLFLGDQGRSRRHRSDRQVRHGEWVYLVMNFAPPHLPEIVEQRSLGDFEILAFPARESTEQLLEKYGNGLTTDSYGFDADVLLPAETHPTIEAPIASTPGETVLVGVTPSEGIDPTFEVVSIPKQAGDVVDIDPTGPGNPRYWSTTVPNEGSRRVSIHQRNSNRHRLIHLHAEPGSSGGEIQPDPEQIGLTIHVDNAPTVLSPLGETQSVKLNEDFTPSALPSVLEYNGPEGLEVEIRATFVVEASLGPTLKRSTQSVEEFIPELVHWVREGCEKVEFEFDGLGTVSIEFPQPTLSTSLNE